MAVGKVIGRYKVGKHFDIVIEDTGLRYQRKQTQIDAEAALDGIYVIRTSSKPEVASAEQTVFHYKSLVQRRTRLSQYEIRRSEGSSDSSSSGQSGSGSCVLVHARLLCPMAHAARFGSDFV